MTELHLVVTLQRLFGIWLHGIHSSKCRAIIVAAGATFFSTRLPY
jgi:hypothetical protein